MEIKHIGVSSKQLNSCIYLPLDLSDPLPASFALLLPSWSKQLLSVSVPLLTRHTAIYAKPLAYSFCKLFLLPTYGTECFFSHLYCFLSGIGWRSRRCWKNFSEFSPLHSPLNFSLVDVKFVNLVAKVICDTFCFKVQGGNGRKGLFPWAIKR